MSKLGTYIFGFTSAVSTKGMYPLFDRTNLLISEMEDHQLYPGLYVFESTASAAITWKNDLVTGFN